MVHQLPPLAHGAVLHGDDGKLVLVDALAHRVAGEDGEVARVLAEQAQRQHVALQLAERLDGEVVARQLQIELVAVGVVAVHQHEGVLHQVGKLHVVAPGQRVFGVGDHDDVLLRLKDLDELGVVYLLVERVDEVQLVFDQQLPQMGDVVAVDVGEHMGKTLVERGHDVRERRGHQRVQRADAHRAGEVLVRGGEGAGAGDGADHVPRVGDEVLAVLRDGDVFSDAVEQLHAQLAFELLDLHGDGGLGVVQRLRRLGKALELGDFQEGNQIADLHRRPLFIMRETEGIVE